ncbi:hypothetical protein [Flavobacterium sp. GSA192]|uniref:hypothetical protein n=1 Tax=Flavobacterium sp. GSA192 TaxID=2576304 RepID=UPI002103EB0B|nr:hypothetical protein [Flavobacterium sp. GSA192]
MFSTFADTDKKQTEKSQQKNEIENSNLSSRARHLERSRETRELNPTIDEIKTYFQENNFPELEAQKFFNYFSSIGWLVGGKTPMVDWQAAAQNWIINSINFNHNTAATPIDRAKHLNTGIDKDYAEPL